MELKEVFPNVFRIDKRLATLNLVSGQKVYDEELIEIKGREYRTWNPYRSKLAAAIINGLKEMHIRPGSKVLYLGAATGTTPSHVSDIIGEEGEVFCVEFSERNMRELIQVCEKRSNMLPFLSDARMTENYSQDVGTVDVLYQDVSARDQADILIHNAESLKKGGFAYVAIKSQSISSSEKPSVVFKEFLDKISQHFEILQEVKIEPFDLGHLFVALRKR
ncbi:MAG: fibrillarin-like rRNA/tRNA 2'-O-methyltransferase [Candidatus Micrarchaeota archaeon]|nr:fibrillarin-like rRNA/tRNA 2'-O-methyltransferase [Candidatus Micrarchaeota archaeon]MDE1804665.1 fibrillarin-like rRNA/tRNA 2'-O-methyltransferase [Candidatus Micrarchaeota archaeon]MDE1846871.1 fibrillarin-like rRNA/tRNA 2'-O-methyltransferase [Candidatus Micrarchaeota archaeon]